VGFRSREDVANVLPGLESHGIGHGEQRGQAEPRAETGRLAEGERRPTTPRQQMARHIEGSGIEVGPGHHPFPLTLPGVEVRFVDRWLPAQSAELFPQLATHGEFTPPDIVSDFNTDRLDPVPDASQDFVIASHVLEHLAEPIGFIAEIHRVLRPGGTALILLPDRRRTRDRERPPTPLEHLIEEYRAGVTTVDDAHVIEFLKSRGKPLGTTPEERREVVDHHRRRSVHVHCWDASEFLAVLVWGVQNLDQQWAFVDGVLPGDESPPGIEFGFVLRRGIITLAPAIRSTRLQVSWETWCNSPMATHRIPPGLRSVRLLAKARRRARTYLGFDSSGR
jgi:SAM-dependent methyltransferase